MELAPKRLGDTDLRGILSTRRGTLTVALLCALVAAGIIVLALSNYRTNANNANAQSTVFVARGLIQKGTAGDAIAAQGLSTSTRILQKQVSAGAIADAAALRGQVAIRDILPGQQLTAADFAAGVGIATTLAATERAMAIPLDQAHGLVGDLQAGDHVDIYGGFNVDQGSARPAPVMRLLIPNVRVLQAASGGGGVGGGSQSANVVVDVSDVQAGKIAFTAENGKIWLVLRPGNGASTPVTFETLASVLTGSTPIQSPTLTKQIQQIAAKGQR